MAEDSRAARDSIAFAPITERNVGAFRVLNASVLPVQYQAKFYTDVLKTPPEVTKLALYNELVVGGVACRLEDREDGKSDLYIMTLSVLAAYRRRGVGRRLIESVLAQLDSPKFANVVRLYLHVQTSNDAALEFYKKFGFTVTDTIKDYYKRIDPPDCFVLSKPVVPGGSGAGAPVTEASA